MRRSDGCFRDGMTLVELLVAIAILAILASVGMLVVAGGREAARRTATQATVVKIGDILTQRYESYLERKIPLSSEQIDQLALNVGFWNEYWGDLPSRGYWKVGSTDGLALVINTLTPMKNQGYLLTPQNIKQWVLNNVSEPAKTLAAINMTLSKMRSLVRLTVMRELIRLEMPEKPADLWVMNTDGSRTSTPRAPLWSKYGVSALTTPAMEYMWSQTNVKNLNQADLLHLVVMQSEPEMLSQFSESEVGDIGFSEDGSPNPNGLKEFIDAWGTPLIFFRWTPGYLLSEIQSSMEANMNGAGDLVDWSPYIDGKLQSIKKIDSNGDSNFVQADTYELMRSYLHENDPDPLDVQRLDPYSWRTVPMVVSAGPDGEFGMFFDQLEAWTNQTFMLQQPDSGGDQTLFGSPMKKEGGLFKHSLDQVSDNVTNHQLSETQQ